MKFVFVVLHYLSFEDTSECVNSILTNVEYSNYSIVIVDNASPNDSKFRLSQLYNGNIKVTLLESNDNVGFAKGNNVGFQYAKNKLGADYIILINNDTLIEQKDFLSNLINIHERTHFNILGPDIVSTKDFLHQNPQRLDGFSYAELKSFILKLQILRVFNFLRVENLYVKIKSLLLSKEGTNGYAGVDDWRLERFNVQLHGACLIFDPIYVKKYKGLYSETFMYCEEDILTFVAEIEKLKIVYSPHAQILHKEASATEKTYGTNRKKKAFIYRNVLRSFKLLVKLRDDNSLVRENLIEKSSN
ncbi:hypothetical protein ASG31_03810 [Chryseobacterium sp. Leaf404]|uniref:glycosyltransferase n=1 Tax=unclassified Chryseobacterium TaxID=2593645 RepID=UPI0006F4736A|nr:MULTISPECIES: glycosyltransferase family 2 protein [unclassified Chryseobacterium]KQT17874.1 hypothetical protein ASG31_03810 [Chryseobacterium sp. Leaf404]